MAAAYHFTQYKFVAFFFCLYFFSFAQAQEKEEKGSKILVTCILITTLKAQETENVANIKAGLFGLALGCEKE